MKIKIKHLGLLVCVLCVYGLFWGAFPGDTRGRQGRGTLGKGQNVLSPGEATSFVGRWNIGGLKGLNPNVHFSKKGVTWFTTSEGFARQLQVSEIGFCGDVLCGGGCCCGFRRGSVYLLTPSVSKLTDLFLYGKFCRAHQPEPRVAPVSLVLVLRVYLYL